VERPSAAKVTVVPSQCSVVRRKPAHLAAAPIHSAQTRPHILSFSRLARNATMGTPNSRPSGTLKTEKATSHTSSEESGTDQRLGVSFDQQDGGAVGGWTDYGVIGAYAHTARHDVKCAESHRTQDVAWRSSPRRGRFPGRAAIRARWRRGRSGGGASRPGRGPTGRPESVGTLTIAKGSSYRVPRRKRRPEVTPARIGSRRCRSSRPVERRHAAETGSAAGAPPRSRTPSSSRTPSGRRGR
jgi:hypothetical protein